MHSLTLRTHEVLNQKSATKQLDISAKSLIVKEKQDTPDMTVTSALQVQEAFQRRGIALVFADLITHESYTRTNVSQLANADKSVWQMLLEEGVRPKRDETGVLALDSKLMESLQSYRDVRKQQMDGAKCRLVPQVLQTAIENNFGTDGLHSLPSSRTQWFAKWTERAKQLQQRDMEIKNALPDHAAKILEAKRLALFKEILEDLEYPDVGAFDELVDGTDLVGEVKPFGIFEKSLKPAERTVQQLREASKSERMLDFFKCSSSGDKEIDDMVYSKTLEEVEFGWATGPLQLEDLPGDAVISRRFGLRQPGKIRLIDDLSASGINQTVQTAESPKPHSADFIAAMLLAVLKVSKGVKALNLIWSCFFDDYVVFSRDEHVNNAEQSVSLLFKLLGWKFAEEGDKADTFCREFGALGIRIILDEADKGPNGKQAAYVSVALSNEQMELLGSETKKTIIFEAELLALVLAFSIWREYIAVIKQNPEKEFAYSARKSVLADFMEFLATAGDSERGLANEILGMIDDLSSDEDSPTRNDDEPEEERRQRERAGHSALIARQSAMSMQLAGCSSGPGDVHGGCMEVSWFGIEFLTLWTLLLGAYSWWTLRNPNFEFIRTQAPRSSRVCNAACNWTHVTSEDISLESLVTWSHLGRSHVEAYGHYIKLLYLQGIETNGLMQCFSEAFSMPEPRQDDGDSDESIPEETHPNRWTERVLAT
ncbi:unnamed protein product [Cladocopium goreaui]|uniref:Reverse transcriptase domain-containing protein n=1 Tax=Cladocopium goreaui TaxID=2562237 RepID=A0A9P1DHH3_9DINO|nr:unnamed protein product [Cladocopium goreaui]